VQGKSIIVKSGQLWKAAIGLVLLVGGATTDAIFSFVVHSHGSLANNVQAASTALAALGFVYLCTGLRCPQCGAKWIWMGVTGKLSPKSLDTLATLERCPTCGYAGIPPIAP